MIWSILTQLLPIVYKQKFKMHWLWWSGDANIRFYILREKKTLKAFFTERLNSYRTPLIYERKQLN